MVDARSGSKSSRLRPLTDEEVAEQMEAMREADALREAILSRRNGKLIPPSWRLIRRARDGR